MRIADDGVGIPRERLQAIASHGLASMRHRITALGGVWHLNCPPDGGTTVTAVVPLSRVLSEAGRDQPSL